MKNKKFPQNNKILAAIFSAIAVFFAAAGILLGRYIIPRMNTQMSVFESSGEDRKHHVLVVGQADNSAFLNQVFEGAKSLADQFDAVVELGVPNLQAENTSLQSLVNYGAYTNCDGIIAYITPTTKNLDRPIRADGTEIPMITIGHYIPEISQISFIGLNYSTLGRQIAMESEQMARESDISLLVVSSNSSNPNSGNMVSNLTNYYRAKGISSYEILDKTDSETFERILKVIENPEIKRPSIICLTEEDSLKILRFISSVEVGKKINILGYGENETLNMYLHRGLLTKLISLDPVKIGRSSMLELFEFRKHGYANSYINAEFRVRTKQ